MKYFDTSVFSQPAAATFGNTTRNESGVRGPGFTALDFSLVKRFTFGRSSQFFEFRTDAFNLTNTPAWNNPNTTFGNAAFGTITGATNQRVIRFALKYAFYERDAERRTPNAEGAARHTPGGPFSFSASQRSTYMIPTAAT